MDNKQDRQFFWNVKDFLNKKPEAPAKKMNPLKEVINQVTNSPQNVSKPIYEVTRDSIVNSSAELKNKVTGVLSSFQKTVNGQKPASDKHSQHITANIFRKNG